MPLTPTYTVIPHGIKLAADGKKVAVFKMQISVKEFETTPSGSPILITEKDWIEFKRQANEMRWSYTLPEQLADKFTLHFVIGSTIRTQDSRYSDIAFEIPGNETIPGAKFSAYKFDPLSFNIGIDSKGGQNLDFVGSGKHQLYKKDHHKINKVRQFQDSFLTGNVDTYNDYLTKATTSAKKSNLKSFVEEEFFDFRMIYASIMNEPHLAEVHFGLIREFRIWENDLPKGSDLLYRITTDQHQPTTEYPFLFKRWFERYYNGLAKFFFVNNDTEKDFKEVKHAYCDPYKAVLDQKKPHYDGIYAFVAYKAIGPNEIDDPFKKSKYLAGFNVVLRDNNFVSLSRHEKHYTFPSDPSKIIKFRTSGVMNPRADMHVENDGVRSNTLFIWRGDNMIVNRDSENEAQKKAIKKNLTKTIVRTSRDCENHFIYENLFVVQDFLIEKSQPILFDNKISGPNPGHPYFFLVRTVGVTGHYLPCKSELVNGEEDYTITVDNIVSGTANYKRYSFFNGSLNLDLNNPSIIPIKSGTFVGRKKFDDKNPGLVDTQTHMVLDWMRKENREVRFFFPSLIKWEDFKALGNIRRARIGDDSKYVGRCIELEQRQTNVPPKMALARMKPNYLSDPRSAKIAIVAADFFTYINFGNVIVDDVFEISKNYPFFDKLKSAKILAKKEKNVSPTHINGKNESYILKVNNKLVKEKLGEGMYHFKIYVLDNNKTYDFNQYNSTPFKISFTGKPIAPTWLLPSADDVWHTATRNHQKDENSWFFSVGLNNNHTWKSLKYVDETEVLDMNIPDADRLLRKYHRKNQVKVEYFLNEYPYDIFLTKQGNADQLENLQTMLYPSKITIHLHFENANLGLPLGTEIFSIRLNDKERIYAIADQAKYKLFLNNKLLIEGIDTVMEVFFNSLQNTFQFKFGPFTNDVADLAYPVDPSIGIYDIQIPDQVLAYLRTNTYECKLTFLRENHYNFASDLKNRYSSKKRIRLFASSPYQGYFPKVDQESKLGTSGDDFNLFIPNNCEPVAPLITTSLLLQLSKDRYWNDKESKKEKSISMRHLIKLSLGPDFMREGKNRLGIIVRELSDTPSNKYVSLVGEDITKLGGDDFSGNNFKDFITYQTEGSLFSKYFEVEPNETLFANYLIEGKKYEVMLLKPFYDTDKKTWQVVFPLANLKNSEVMFAKIAAIKVSPGLPMDQQTGVLHDFTNTNLSKPTIPDALPIYNQRTFKLIKNKGSFTVKYEGPFSVNQRKLFFLILFEKGFNISKLLSENTMLEHLREFSVGDQKGKIYMFTEAAITFARERFKAAILLEFEVHENSEIEDYRSRFVTFNPLFDITGIRLINAAEFES